MRRNAFLSVLIVVGLNASIALVASGQAKYVEARFTSPQILIYGEGGTVGYNQDFVYNTTYGDSWRMVGYDAYVSLTFNVQAAPESATLIIRHLSSADPDCPGGGYSPVDIVVNGTTIAADYDPAENHSGTHLFVTDEWDVAAHLQAGSNTVRISICGDACTHYWISHLRVDWIETKEYTLTVTANPSNGGTVTLSPDKAKYSAGEQVTLTATPAPGYGFSRWSGSIAGWVNPVTITINYDMSITAVFEATEYTLTTNVTPPGGGTVTRSPDKAKYSSGEQVVLTATPATGYVFTGWSGDLSGTTNPTTIVMNSAKSITARFERMTVQIVDPLDATTDRSCMVVYRPATDSPTLSLQAKAQPLGGTCTWQIVKGQDKVRFTGSSSAQAIKIQAKNASTQKWDVEVEVTYSFGAASQTSPAHFVTVQKPTSLIEFEPPKQETDPKKLSGLLYWWIYKFQVVDQFGEAIGRKGMSVWEGWDKKCETHETWTESTFEKSTKTNKDGRFLDDLTLEGQLFFPWRGRMDVPRDYVRKQTQAIKVGGWPVDLRCQTYEFSKATSVRGDCGLCPGRSTLVAVTTAVHGRRTQYQSVRIDPTVQQVTFGIAWPGSDFDLTLRSPDGREIGPDTVEQYAGVEFARGSTYERYTVQQPMPGEWTILVVAVDVPPEGEDCRIEVMAESSLAFSLAVSETGHQPGDSIAIAGELLNDGAAMVGVTVVADVNRPDGTVDQLTFYDDGTHGDASAGDGRYTSVYVIPQIGGVYSITSTATGTVYDERFQRMATSRFYAGDTPDLAASDIALSNDAPLPGDTITVSATVSNVGAGDAADASVIFYSEDGTNGEVLAQHVVNVASGESVTVAADWTVARGHQTVYVVATGSDKFLEANYENNTASRDICATTIDLNGDGIVDFADLAILCEYWLDEMCSFRESCNGADLNCDEVVDLHDYVAFSAAWQGPAAVVSVSPQPIAHWEFDDGTGALASDSAGANPGVVYGAQWVDGRLRGALSFDGKNDYVDCGNAEVLAPEQMTLALWAFFEDNASYQYLLGKATNLSPSRDYALLTTGDGKPEFSFGESASSQVLVRSGEVSPVGQWVHLVATRDGSIASLYVNGQLESSAAYTFSVMNKGYGLRIGSIGSKDGWAGFFEGMIDDVRIYDQALSADEIQGLYGEASP